MTNLYYIENRSCDETKGLAIIPDEFWNIFQTTIENLNNNSTYGCMPKIAVYKIDENIIREATKDDPKYINAVKQVSKEVRDKILNYLMIRRTRTDIKKHYEKDL